MWKYSSSQKKLESSRESRARLNANAQTFSSCSRRVRAFRAYKCSCISLELVRKTRKFFFEMYCSEPIAGHFGLFSTLLSCSPFTLYTAQFQFTRHSLDLSGNVLHDWLFQHLFGTLSCSPSVQFRPVAKH